MSNSLLPSAKQKALGNDSDNTEIAAPAVPQAASMSPDEQCIAIAEACGWRDIRMHAFTGDCEIPAGLRPRSPNLCLREIPDYPNDLNAMNEAEMTLTKRQGRKYHSVLCDVLRDGDKWPDGVKLISAKAAQRAEAFLRTINRWKAP